MVKLISELQNKNWRMLSNSLVYYRPKMEQKKMRMFHSIENILLDRSIICENYFQYCVIESDLKWKKDKLQVEH